MPTKDPETAFRHIVEAIDTIDGFIGDMTFEAYEEDRRTSAATERFVSNLTEAAIRLGDDATSLCPGPDWPNIRGMGNVLRHEYDRIINRQVWNTVKNKFPQLRIDVLDALKRLGSDTSSFPS